MSYTLTLTGPTEVSPYVSMQTFYKSALLVVAKQHGRPAAIMSGCAFGIDTDVLRAAIELWPGIHVIFAVPDAPHNTAMVAFLQASYRGRMTEHVIKCAESSLGKRYMARNDWMSDHGTVLAAFPRTAHEELRSGTWSTIRRFKKRGKTFHLFPLNMRGPNAV